MMMMMTMMVMLNTASSNCGTSCSQYRFTS